MSAAQLNETPTGRHSSSSEDQSPDGQVECVPSAPQEAVRALLHGSITLTEAKDNEKNILHMLEYPKLKDEFYNELSKSRYVIEGLVAHHLGLGQNACHVSEQQEWLHGSFNLCVPILVNKGFKQNRVMIRFPLPYRVGEEFRPGNIDEKLRTEAGAYAWVQENCPSIPIPQLYGFGLSTGRKFTALEHLPLLSRYFHLFRRQVMTWLGHPPSSQYVCHQGRNEAQHSFYAGYLLLEYIDPSQGQMLSDTWGEKSGDEHLRTNLYRSLARILLTVARVPLPRIGAFRLDDEGRLSLANRPLSFDFVTMENERIPLDIPRDTTYSSVDSFVLEVLSTHDSRLLHQPNGTTSLYDGVYQAAGLAAARTVFPYILRHDLRRGPFTFNFTDLHQSNIFVDKEWNITKLIDLEYSCSYPLEFQQPPYWLSSQSVDRINEEEYEKHWSKFVAVLAEEERKLCDREHETSLSSVMQQSWQSGAFWVSLAVTSPTGFCKLFYKHILPHLSLSEEMHSECYLLLMKLWRPDSSQIISAKELDKKEYDRKLEEAFLGNDAESSPET